MNSDQDEEMEYVNGYDDSNEDNDDAKGSIQQVINIEDNDMEDESDSEKSSVNIDEYNETF